MVTHAQGTQLVVKAVTLGNHLCLCHIPSMIILRLAQLLLVRRVFESGRAALDSFPRTEDVVLVHFLGKVD